VHPQITLCRQVVNQEPRRADRQRQPSGDLCNRRLCTHDVRIWPRTSFFRQRGGFAVVLSASTGASSASSPTVPVRPAVGVDGRTKLGSSAVSGSVNQSSIGELCGTVRFSKKQGLVGVHRRAHLAGDDREYGAVGVDDECGPSDRQQPA
jgi:hypothetical protein